jgi:hypothetical protein
VVCAEKSKIDSALEKVDPKIRQHMIDWFIDGGEEIEYDGKTFIRNHGTFDSENTYEIMKNSDDNEYGGEDEQLAMEQINIFFNELGALSNFDQY